jgi:Predicted Zn peptidase
MSNRRALAISALRMAKQVRSQKGISDNTPLNAIDFATMFCDVWFKGVSSLEGLYSNEPTPTIALGAERPIGRQSFTCAHELGHHFFKHGAKLDELESKGAACKKDDDEYVADLFAGFFLMPQKAMTKTCSERAWQYETLAPLQAYILSNYFGVGYSSVVNHLAYSLKLIPHLQAQDLLRTTPQKIKKKFGLESYRHLHLLDKHWNGKPLDSWVGDCVGVPHSTCFDKPHKLAVIGENEQYRFYQILSVGLIRSFDPSSDWGTFIRTSRPQFVGLAEYRFLDDEEE